MENRRQLTRHCAAVVGTVSFNYLKLCGQTDLQLKGGTVPFFSFFFYVAPGRDASRRCGCSVPQRVGRMTARPLWSVYLPGLSHE
jgi:hypothetical protein